MNMTMIIIIAVVVLILVVPVITISNKFNRLIVKIDEADSDIDVALIKRHDTLTKMLDVVKGYAKHEKETLIKIIDVRKGMSSQEKAEAMKLLDESAQKINVLAEAYPELKSSENYNTLQKSIADTEEHLQAARRMYNANVSAFNQCLVSFPSSVIGSMKGLSKKEFLEADEAQKEDVKMDL